MVGLRPGRCPPSCLCLTVFCRWPTPASPIRCFGYFVPPRSRGSHTHSHPHTHIQYRATASLGGLLLKTHIERLFLLAAVTSSLLRPSFGVPGHRVASIRVALWLWLPTNFPPVTNKPCLLPFSHPRLARSVLSNAARRGDCYSPPVACSIAANPFLCRSTLQTRIGSRARRLC